MLARTLLLLILCYAVACSVKKLGDELERADSTYGYVQLQTQLKQPSSDTILIALYRATPDEVLTEQVPRLVDMRSTTMGKVAIFMEPRDDYIAVAFVDINGDFVYQPGEPAHLTRDVKLTFAEDMGEGNYNLETLPTQHMSLDEDTRIGFPVDLTERSLASQLERASNNFLEITDWDDPIFSPELVKKGLWEPLTFEEQVGYGLYLLEPLDLSRQPVIFVHGINGSPVQFKSLIRSLGKLYQPILFHYPSGFPLDHTAYMLKAGLDELVARHPLRELSLVAHSMGGLVSRGAIVKAAPVTQSKLHSLVTLSTPWLGHKAALLGVKWAPAVAPVWRSMVPNSDYQRQIFAKPLPAHLQHHLYFSYSREPGGPGAADDGVVTIKSQLGYQAQQEARVVRGMDESHNGILDNSCVAAWVAAALHAGQSGTTQSSIAGATPKGC